MENTPMRLMQYDANTHSYLYWLSSTASDPYLKFGTKARVLYHRPSKANRIGYVEKRYMENNEKRPVLDRKRKSLKNFSSVHKAYDIADITTTAYLIEQNTAGADLENTLSNRWTIHQTSQENCNLVWSPHPDY